MSIRTLPRCVTGIAPGWVSRGEFAMTARLPRWNKGEHLERGGLRCRFNIRDRQSRSSRSGLLVVLSFRRALQYGAEYRSPIGMRKPPSREVAQRLGTGA